jgi:hypothetical protein
LKDLQRDIGLSGVQLETNCAGLAAHAAEREAIRLLARALHENSRFLVKAQSFRSGKNYLRAAGADP